MTRRNTFLDGLPQFNETDPTFKELFGDLNRPELVPVTNISDINVGAIYNVLEWHLRFQDLAAKSAVLTDAEQHFLEKWAELLGISRPGTMDDQEFVAYIIGYVLSNEPTIPKVGQVFPPPTYFVLRCDQLGFATDVSASDLGLSIPGPDTMGAPSIITPDRGASYVIVEDMSSITDNQITEVNRIIAAGTVVYLGAVNG